MYSASIRSELRGRTAHGAALLAALALLAVPEPSYAEPDRAAVETTPSGTRFVASVRFVTPWLLHDSVTLHATEGVTALPRFIAGLQLGRVGLGLGLNYFRSYYSTEFDSERNTAFSMFEIGPSVSVRILEGGPDRRAQLHLLLSLVLGAGTATAGEPDDPDVVSSSIAGLGGSFGAFARVMVLSSLALDVGMVADVLLRGGLSPELGTPPEVPEDDWRPNYGFTTLQLLGFVGVTVIL